MASHHYQDYKSGFDDPDEGRPKNGRDLRDYAIIAAFCIILILFLYLSK